MEERIPATQRPLFPAPEGAAWGEVSHAPAVLTPATHPPEGRTESQLESPFARRGGADFCLGGVAVGGSREPTPSRPVCRMAGTKGEQPSPRLRGGGTEETKPVGPGRRGCRGALAAPTPIDTPPTGSVPYPSGAQLSFVGPQTPSAAGSEATEARAAPSRDRAPRRRGAGARGSRRLPPTRPHSLAVPTHPAAAGPPTLRPILAPSKPAARRVCAAGQGRRAGTLRTRGGAGLRSPPCSPALCSGRSAPA